MKKLLLAMVMVGLVSWFPISAVAEDEVVYGCYKEKKGRLRIVDDPSVCRGSEVAISFNELDADLVPGNIRRGVSIFGVVGTYAQTLAGVEKTGQIGCWDSSGAPIPCTGTGQDGEYQMGVAWPTPRFTANIDNNGDGDCDDVGETCDGTVTDNLTGLIWLNNANCPDDLINWNDALMFTNSLHDGWTGDPAGGDCGLSDGSSAGDWRLANVKELQSLIDFGNQDPALPSGHPITGVQLVEYWSSTSIALVQQFAWFVNLGNGYVGYFHKDSAHGSVWPVRGGQ